MLLTLQVVLPVAVLALPVRPVVGDDLGQRYTEGLGHAFWMENKKKYKETKIQRGNFPNKKLKEEGEKVTSVNFDDTHQIHLMKLFTHKKPVSSLAFCFAATTSLHLVSKIRHHREKIWQISGHDRPLILVPSTEITQLS